MTAPESKKTRLTAAKAKYEKVRDATWAEYSKQSEKLRHAAWVDSERKRRAIEAEP